MRLLSIDSRIGPVRNLFTNPSFEAAGALSTIFTNLYTNPSFGTNTTGWNGISFTGVTGSSARVSITDGIMPGSHYVNRAGVDLPGAGTIALQAQVASSPAATAGTAYTHSMYVRSSIATTAILKIDWYTRSGAVFVSSTAGIAVNLPANTWIRLTTTGTCPASADCSRLNVTVNGTWVESNIVDFDCAMATATPAAIDYFDGSETVPGSYFDDPDFTLGWSSTTNASSSVVKGYSLVSTSVGAMTQKAIQSTKWASSGDKSVRMFNTYPAINVNSFIRPDESLIQGRTYTYSVVIHLEAPLAGTLRSESRRIQIRTTGGAVFAQSEQPPNTVGDHLVTLTSEWPTSGEIRIYHGGIYLSGDMWIDDLMITEGPYEYEYMDGSQPGARWLGTPDGSVSVGYAELVS